MSCPYKVPGDQNHITKRFLKCPRLFTEDTTHTYINTAANSGITMRKPSWYLENWDNFMKKKYDSSFVFSEKTPEGIDEMYNFDVLRDIIGKWQTKTGLKSTDDDFLRQYNPTSNSTQYQGLIDMCSMPVTTMCPMVDGKSLPNCPRIKQLNQSISNNDSCYPLYDKSRFTTEELTSMTDKVYTQYCEQCRKYYNDNSHPEYKGCETSCSCINHDLDPGFSEGRSDLQNAMGDGAENVIENPQCWWKPCVNTSQSNNNPYLVISSYDQKCPTVSICKQSVNLEAGGNINVHGKLDISVMCPGTASGGCENQPPLNGSLGGCPSNLKSGASCEPTCNLGYDLSGSNQCVGSTLTRGVCRRQYCGIPPPPTNGGKGTCTKIMQHNDTCTPTCDAGYKLLGVTKCINGSIRQAKCQKTIKKIIQDNLPVIAISITVFLFIVIFAVIMKKPAPSSPELSPELMEQLQNM